MQGRVPGRRAVGVLLACLVTGLAGADYATGRPLTTLAWLAIAPLLASLVLSPRLTGLLAGWTMLLGLAIAIGGSGVTEHAASHLVVLVLLVVFAVVNSVLRSAAQRRLSQARAVARVAQSALLREVPPDVASARLASRYLSASAEARVGGDVLEVVADGPRTRWMVGDTRGKGLPAVRLANVAATTFRDACARPGLSLAEVTRAVDRSVTRAVGEEDFVTAVFAELDPRGWLQIVVCGHPPPLRLNPDGDLEPLAPATFATPLGLHPDLRPATFSVHPGDRLLFFTDGLLEARDRAGNHFRIDQQVEALRRPGLHDAVNELFDRLQEHTRYRLDDDVAVLLVELTSAGARPALAGGASARFSFPPRGEAWLTGRPDRAGDAPSTTTRTAVTRAGCRGSFMSYRDGQRCVAVGFRPSPSRDGGSQE